VLLPNNTLFHAFDITVGVHGVAAIALQPRNGSEYIAANITFLNVQLAAAGSAIGPVAVGPLQTTMNLLCKVPESG
jgi:hypothetical protein